MIEKYSLSGEWRFAFDKEMKGEEKGFASPDVTFDDTMNLPSTTAIEKKGEQSSAAEIWHLAEVYPYSGAVWFSKKVKISESCIGKPLYLLMGRTRMTRVWIDGEFAGENNSLCAPHKYDITDLVRSDEFTITVEVRNTGYPTSGGHMTSPDTQTNWIGITGELELIANSKIEIEKVKTYPNIHKSELMLEVEVINHTANEAICDFCVIGDAYDINGSIDKPIPEFKTVISVKAGRSTHTIIIPMGDCELWSEHNPVVYRLCCTLGEDKFYTSTGMREFKRNGLSFEINGVKTFLRGKHDGMLFPLTGAAPTDVDEWVRILSIAKSYGINHYRYHTSCPPEAAFEAADIVGIYMEPQLPFWGTLYGHGEDGFAEQQNEQEYLISEGVRILEAYGNHPSFCMMSLGNELWGSEERMKEILRKYKALDNRHLYSQGSNNYQWCPKIFEEDDYFVGVRFDLKRQLRGSYAMCDAPLGFIQTDRPSTRHCYDEAVIPGEAGFDNGKSVGSDSDVIEIQYKTGVKKVKAQNSGEVFIPEIPVVTHEVGQYGMYPDYKEIEKYTGVTRARNFEIFKKSLEDAKLADMQDKFFRCSGRLAVSCYKEELEAALRSEKISGYQILDLQDFNGQGTALVGILDSFMDSKGLIAPDEWCEFCSDAVVMASFDKYNFKGGEQFTADVLLAWYRDYDMGDRIVNWSVFDGERKAADGIISASATKNGLSHLGKITFAMPDTDKTRKLTLSLKIKGMNIKNHYSLWVYPEADYSALGESVLERDGKTAYITEDFEEAKKLLAKGEKVLLLCGELPEDKKIKGAYCTDFWNFPMFKSISESMKKPIPTGTMGMVINKEHPSISEFATDDYTTQQWFDIIENADCCILDGSDIKPIIQVIDNVERNHKLSILFETEEFGGKLLVCSSRLLDIPYRPEIAAFAKSILDYIVSESF